MRLVFRNENGSALIVETPSLPDHREPTLCFRKGWATPASVTGARASWNRRIGVGILLAAATLAAHGRSVSEGLWLDDHWHQARIREMGWSVGELLDATTIEPDRLIDTWWQDRPVRWKYTRPVAVLLMKVVHHVSGGAPAAHHAVSLFLHWVSACLVYQLCRLLTRHRFWSVVGGLIFVVYAHGVFAVAWLAAQNSVLQTTLMLAAVLCYIHASGLVLGPTSARMPDATDVPRLKRPTCLLALVFWLAALFSRESSIVFPVLAVALDAAFGGRRYVRQRLGLYMLLGVLGGAYVFWRLLWYYHAMPSPYVRSPSDGGYVMFCAVKLLHYLCSSIWQSPMTIGPTGRYDPLAEAPGDCLLMLIIVVVLGAAYYIACHKARGWWLWPLWMALFVLPVVPILATPQSGYPCGVAFAVAVVLGPGLSRVQGRKHAGRLSRPIALAFLIATCTYVPIYRITWEGMIAAEQYTIVEITADPPPDGVTDLFFLNLPFVNVYVRTHLAELWGESMRDVRCHVLTYAPELLRMAQPCTITQHDAYSFSIAVEGRPYFSRLLGRYLIEALRAAGPLKQGEAIAGDLFDVTITRADDGGVRELRFRFHHRLAGDRYRFYVSTSDCGASRLAFAAPGTTLSASDPVDMPRRTPHNSTAAAWRRVRDRLFDVRETAAGIVRTDLYLTGRPFPGPRSVRKEAH